MDISYKNILIILSFGDINQDTNGRIANSSNMISPEKTSLIFLHTLSNNKFPLHYLILPLLNKIYDNITFLLSYEPTENFENTKNHKKKLFMKNI